MKSIIEVKAVLNAVAAVIPIQLGDMVRDCVANIPNTAVVQHSAYSVVPGLSSIEAAHCLDNQKIPAIKALRERTGLGLKEAKELVEFWMFKGEWDLRRFL